MIATGHHAIREGGNAITLCIEDPEIHMSPRSK
ncbi:MAG: hypothetical protein JWQ98_3205, partial [Chlorobi bacterium]|nr:hypothetical protein [Chlorobiota bacterium]